MGESAAKLVSRMGFWKMGINSPTPGLSEGGLVRLEDDRIVQTVQRHCLWGVIEKATECCSDAEMGGFGLDYEDRSWVVRRIGSDVVVGRGTALVG